MYKRQITDGAETEFYADSTEPLEDFPAGGAAEQREAYERFCANTAYWLDDFALFMALKEHHKDQEGGVWNQWPSAIAKRQVRAMKPVSYTHLDVYKRQV